VPSVHRYRSILFLFLLGLLGGCGAPGVATLEPPATPPPAVTAAELQAQIALLLEQGDVDPPCCVLDWPRLRDFYRQRGQFPVWWDLPAARRKPAADELLEILGASPRHGLDPGDYHEAELRALWPATSAADLARSDLLLTDAFLAYTRHLSSGRYAPQLLDPKWHIEPRQVDAAVLLDGVVDSADFRARVDDLAPPHAGYRHLQRSLERYRQLAMDTPWPIITGGPLLRPGEREMRVRDLRKRLWLEGYTVPEVADEYLYDAGLEQAVSQFQFRHGVRVDGVIGPSTLTMLNISPEQRIWQILLNMERWRWLPRDLGRRYLMVNMAGYHLQVVEDERIQLEMRVIIGTAYRTTPAFVGSLRYLVVNPDWNVPKTILREDIIPRQRKAPGYLASQNIRVLENWQPGAREIDPADIDWETIDPRRFPYRLRQDPGPANSLGRVKFMMPNAYDIYLHDTPGRHLFQETVRTFSSGCIRLERPLELANYLLDSAGGWDRARLQQTIDSGVTRNLVLSEPVPVYILYWTAWADDQGLTYFVDDVYGLDRSMLVNSDVAR
jgi:murein L,D-transpeptidase YcbB/YkuD